MKKLNLKKCKMLNLGSGKDWREDCLNVDIEEKTNPDMILDICTDNLYDAFDRLSDINREVLRRKIDSSNFSYFNHFERIFANDILEHLPDLKTAMTNCLHLLKVGGVMEISVPYDLSINCWRDPTHVRGFNEESFIYFTDWFWYMGWVDSRFEMKDPIQVEVSNYGHQLRALGQSMETIMRTPRAVDSLRVNLTKVLTTDQEKQIAKEHYGGAQTD